MFHELSLSGARRVAFAGVDEVAEIAYLSLQEFDMDLAGAFDDAKEGANFFKSVVRPFSDVHDAEFDRIVLSTFLRRREVYQKLLENRVPEEKILAIYDLPQ
jgi:hypothetical protein